MTSRDDSRPPATFSGTRDPAARAGCVRSQVARPAYLRRDTRKAHQFDETVGSTPEDVRCSLVRIAGDLDRLGVAKADRDAIEVVLAECMNNVVEHAYGQRPGRRFDLRLCLSGDSLFCRVEDDGAPMPGLTPPQGQLQDLTVDLPELPEGGFGWFLIRELTQDLRYVRQDNRNALSFRIRLGQVR